MPCPLGGGTKRCFCLTSVCLSRTSGITREERGLGRIKIGTQVDHVTRDWDTTFFQGQRSKFNLQGVEVLRRIRIRLQYSLTR